MLIFSSKIESNDLRLSKFSWSVIPLDPRDQTTGCRWGWNGSEMGFHNRYMQKQKDYRKCQKIKSNPGQHCLIDAWQGLGDLLSSEL